MVAEKWGNWETLEKVFCFCDPCVGICGTKISPMVFSACGNFPGREGERDQQRELPPSLRRLALRPPSASGRRGCGRKTAF